MRACIFLGATLILSACVSSVTMKNGTGNRIECKYRPPQGSMNVMILGDTLFGPAGGGPSPREEVQNCVDAAEARGYHRAD